VTESIQPIRGMNDVLPGDIAAWQRFEAAVRELVQAYGYEEIRTPIVERTELFRRAIGEHTDVVEKEMYSFVDQGGDALTLRPEATAGVLRAVISNGLLRGARLRLWSMGPMFRHERPQKGRYRQFHQVNLEAIGFAGPDADAEVIALTARLWRRIGLTRVKLQVNSLGTPESRRAYRERLVAYFRAHESALDADSRRRLEGNPLRILDSKNPAMQPVIAAAPLLTEHLDPESRAHFDALSAALKSLGIAFEVNPRLVRGLDYYTRTVFEWITDALGAQDAVCSGGRYDGLISQLGGDATPAVGCAMGIERIVEILRQGRSEPPRTTADVYIVVKGQRGEATALSIAEDLRQHLQGARVELNLGGGAFDKQFKRADKSGARVAIIVGDEELARGVVALKPLRRESGQTDCPIAGLAAAVEAELSVPGGS
jgi:histidyl-tRNA synthetase